MMHTFGSVSIFLASIVLDRPDQSGLYIAKDLAGGWAYLITDAEGDSRFRGQGACAGGVDVALRCAFLSAVGCVPDCGSIRVMVESRQSHMAMVQLARSDAHAIAVIAGREVMVMTRPLERASYHVRSAAERAASGALQERERVEWQSADISIVEPPRAVMSSWRMRRGAGAIPPPVSIVPVPVRVSKNPPKADNPLGGWLNSLETCVATVTGGLRDIGA